MPNTERLHDVIFEPWLEQDIAQEDLYGLSNSNGNHLGCLKDFFFGALIVARNFYQTRPHTVANGDSVCHAGESSVSFLLYYWHSITRPFLVSCHVHSQVHL